MKQIIVVPFGKDWKAYDKDAPGYWDCGKTPSAAIGELMRTHPEHFGIMITYPQSKEGEEG